MTAQTPAGWDGILDEDETILWQGRPDAGLVLKDLKLLSALHGLFFMGFSLYWMTLASELGTHYGGSGVEGFLPMILPLFGLVFFMLGFYNGLGHIFWDAYLRSKTHYTLTSNRAFVATAHPSKGKLLTDYKIDTHTIITLKAGPPDSIFFKSEKIGFKRIEDGRKVHKLMRQFQENSQ